MKTHIFLLFAAFISMQCEGQNKSRSKSPLANEPASNNKQASVYSLSEVHELSDSPSSLILMESGRMENYKYDPTDKASPDDGILTLVTAKGRRYKRVLAGYTVNLKTDFGAKGDGQTDDAAKLQNAITFQQANPTVVITVPAGTYKLSTTCIKKQSFEGLEIRAVPNSVVFDYSGLAKNQSCLKIIGGSGRLCQNTIEGIIFKGNSNTVGIEIAGQCGQFVNKCVFQNNLVGLQYHNDAKGSFTEWCTAQNCSWENTCQYDVQYKRSAGNNSFHGSGLTGVNFVTTYTGDGAVLLIDQACLPYNCPLNVQVWFANKSTLIRNNNTNPSEKPFFAGNVSFEHFGGGLIMATGKQIYFSGSVESLGDYVDSGLFYQCAGVSVNKNNSTTPYGIRYNTQMPLASTTNTLLNAPFGAIYQVAVTVVGANYDYRTILIVDSSGGGSGTGSATTLTTTRAFNASGYGPPTFGIDGEGKLTISNSAYPASGAKQLTAYITYNQIADHYYGNYPAKSF